MKDSRNKKESNTIVAFSRWIAPHTHIPPNKRILLKKRAITRARRISSIYLYVCLRERESVYPHLNGSFGESARLALPPRSQSRICVGVDI